jgi:hypothetical protein
MHDKELIDGLLASGRIREQEITRWRDLAGLLAIFEAIGRDGVIAIIKVDGERVDSAVYTVVVSGPRLGGALFHQDGSDLSALLNAAITFYRSNMWTEPSID